MKVSININHSYLLAGGIPTPLKNVSLSIGMIKFPAEWI